MGPGDPLRVRNSGRFSPSEAGADSQRYGEYVATHRRVCSSWGNRVASRRGSCRTPLVGFATSGEGLGSMLNTLSPEEFQFIQAIEKYKAENGKTFLSWSEVLKIVLELGYRQTSPEPVREAETQE